MFVRRVAVSYCLPYENELSSQICLQCFIPASRLPVPRHILQCHVSCTFVFFCTYSSQRISVQRLSLILCNFLPHLLLNFLVGYTLFGVMCSFPLRSTVLGHAYVQNSYISLFCALIINHISFMEVHRSFFF